MNTDYQDIKSYKKYLWKSVEICVLI